MNERNYYHKQGNLESPLTIYLTDRNGRVPSFSGKSVEFFIWSHGSPINDVVDGREGEFGDPTTGEVKMPWQAGDVDTAGVFHVEVDLISAGDRRETFPAKDAMTLVVQPRNAA